MIKLKRLFCFLILVLLFSVTSTYAQDSKADLIKNARSGVLMDASSGQILFEKDKDKRVAPASMTKMVAQIIILENIENGNLSWDEKIKTSENAAGMGGSQIWLQPGEEMTVRDLMKGITMASANDAVVAMAERLGGTEEKFVEMMNNKVKELGLKNTNFVNPTGLDEDNHYSSAYDMAMISKELLNHEQILEFSSVYEDYIRVDTPNKFWVVNTNKLVRFYQGADGLKTGFTDNAKYCMAVTAKRDNMRLIAIVLGEDSGKVRNSETMEMLDYGFNLYKVDLVKSKTDKVGTIKIDKANKEEINVYPKKDITILGKKSESSLKYDVEFKKDNVTLPLKKGSVVGSIIVKNGNNIISSEEAVINEDVKPIGFIKLFLNNFKDITTGNLI